jgi:aminomethyltransferase
MSLATKLNALGARFRDESGEQVPAYFGDMAEEVRLIRREAGWIDRSARGRIALKGPERLAFLQALLTNDVLKIQPHQGVYGFFLTNKGRIVSDARVYPLEEKVLLDVEPGTRDAVLAYLDKYHFTEKIEMEDETATLSQIGLFGMKAVQVFDFLFPGQEFPQELEIVPGNLEGSELTAVGNILSGGPGLDLFVPSEKAELLVEKLTALHVKPIGWDALEIARMESGIPRFGIEMTENTIPLETGLGKKGISFSKGCYIGQEIIARIDARGEPAKRLVGFSIEGEPPAPGTAVRQKDRQVGTIVSSLRSPSLRGRPIAMGYVQKDVEELDQDLFAGDTKIWIVPRPFYPPHH